ncbi:RNB domain-containing ribonuclease [Ilumatobacter nonamiensis]|uniref:RNB domain-containing ribonuclease n=1 Tax=Ilumatobacter nonamiensis TaxID=467093 RepID=UPI00034A3777|nr:RNB domain-containing ribonuclease [Ilumatobacter nonamiensis]
MARTGPTVLPDDTIGDFRDGFAKLRADFDVPGEHPPGVIAAAEAAASRPFDVVPSTTESPGRWQHVDRTDVEFATLDPASSTDLDQAFAVEMAGDDVILHYAIADVGWFVRPGDPIDEEAWKRGVTIYLPDGRAGLHPDRIAEDAGSLLPGSPKPAIVFTVRVAEDGSVVLAGAERAMIRNRAKLAYATVTEDDLPSAFPELSRRIERAERARGAERIDWPEQEVVRVDGGGFTLRFRPRNEAEQQNAAMSLATNMAIADALWSAGTGLFRTMPPVDERHLGRLRNTARAFGLDWPRSTSLGDFERGLPRDDPRTAAFQLAIRRASGGASYTPFAAFGQPGGPPDRGVKDGKPWHAALAATYVHATAPLRRLADRHVIEATLAIANGRDVPAEIGAAFAELPSAMSRGTSLANRVDRAAIDLAEAILLDDRVGQSFDAVVTDEDDRGARIQIGDPAVVTRTVARRVDPGDAVRVKLTAVDVAERSIEVERVG